MSYVSLGRFTLQEDGGEPCWTPPSGVTSVVDLTPPGQDSDPDVNYAMMLSDAPLDSGDCHYSYGSGNVTEMQIDGIGRDAWESVTGYRPAAATIAECLAEHLLAGSDPTGQDFTRPLTAGFNRRLDVYLGGNVWTHTLSGTLDPLAMPVMRVEAEGLAQIYREQGEIPYRMAMGALYKKYQFYGPVWKLIEFLFPSGRDDLPLLEELWPQTVITETCPTVGNLTSGQDNGWTFRVGNAITVPTAGRVGCVVPGAQATNNTSLNYTFGSSDRECTRPQSNSSASGVGSILGMFTRADSTLANGYYGRSSISILVLLKRVSGTNTALTQSTGETLASSDVLKVSAIGSTLKLFINSTQKLVITDTSITTGTASGFSYTASSAHASESWGGPFVFDDLVTGGSNTFLPVLFPKAISRSSVW